MKYLSIILILLLLSIFVVSCDSNYTLQADTIPETVTVTETVIVEDTARIAELEKQLEKKDTEAQQYRELINNLNNLLANVYYGYASNNKWTADGFTAFSMEYKDKYYLITAGHAVENPDGKMTNFKFKANFSNEWIYPKLLDYKFDKMNLVDYAIFYSDKINSGLKYNLNNLTKPSFILGAGKLNLFKEYGYIKSGESGSPIININGEVIEILTGDRTATKIEIVIQAIDKLE